MASSFTSNKMSSYQKQAFAAPGIQSHWFLGLLLFISGTAFSQADPISDTTPPDTITVQFYDFDLFDYIEEYTETIRSLDYQQDSSYRIRNAENAGQIDSVFFLHNPLAKAIVYESGDENELFLLHLESSNVILLKKLWRSYDSYTLSFPGHRDFINKLVVQSDDYELTCLFTATGKLLKFSIVSNFLE
jgi:hypothetical protein